MREPFKYMALYGQSWFGMDSDIPLIPHIYSPTERADSRQRSNVLPRNGGMPLSSSWLSSQ
jgi:hypothetical protein